MPLLFPLLLHKLLDEIQTVIHKIPAGLGNALAPGLCLAFDVVEHVLLHSLRFLDDHVAADGRAVNIRTHVIRDLLGQLLNGLGDAGTLGAREQHAVDPERRIGVFLHRLVSIIQLGDAGRRKCLRHGRDEQIVGSRQCVHGQQAERRRTVDEDVIVFFRNAGLLVAQLLSERHLFADVVQLLLNARKDGVRRNDIAAGRVLDGLPRRDRALHDLVHGYIDKLKAIQPLRLNRR